MDEDHGAHQMSEIKDHLMKIAESAFKKIEDDLIRDIDGSLLDREHNLNMLEVISKCELWIDVLLTQTEEVNGFGSSYPKRCLELLKTFRVILEMELK